MSSTALLSRLLYKSHNAHSRSKLYRYLCALKKEITTNEEIIKCASCAKAMIERAEFKDIAGAALMICVMKWEEQQGTIRRNMVVMVNADTEQTKAQRNTQQSKDEKHSSSDKGSKHKAREKRGRLVSEDGSLETQKQSRRKRTDMITHPQINMDNSQEMRAMFETSDLQRSTYVNNKTSHYNEAMLLDAELNCQIEAQLRPKKKKKPGILSDKASPALKDEPQDEIDSIFG